MLVFYCRRQVLSASVTKESKPMDALPEALRRMAEEDEAMAARSKQLREEARDKKQCSCIVS